MNLCPPSSADITERLQYIHDNWMSSNDKSIWLEAKQEIVRLRELSQDPFVNAEAKKREQAAYEEGVKQGMKLAGERVRRSGRGMWDHIATLIEGKTDADTH